MGLFCEEHPHATSPLLRSTHRYTIYGHRQMWREPFDRCVWYSSLRDKGSVSTLYILLGWFSEQISNIRSYARIALDLFRVDAPNGIGSVSSFKLTPDTRSGEPNMGPYILPSGLYTPSIVFQSIEEYLKWLISVKKILAGVGTAKPDLDEAKVTLERLETSSRSLSLATKTLHF